MPQLSLSESPNRAQPQTPKEKPFLSLSTLQKKKEKKVKGNAFKKKDKVENSRTKGGFFCGLCPGERKNLKREKINNKAVEKETTTMQKSEQQQQPPATALQGVANSGSLSFNSSIASTTGVGVGVGADEEITRSALSNFRAKEEEIEKKKMEVRERVQAQLGRVEEETKRLALIREELEALADPMRKDVSMVRKRIDVVNKELKPLGTNVQKKEKEYKDALDAFNEKNKEKVQLINKLVELVGESERLRMKKLEELSKSVESMR